MTQSTDNLLLPTRFKVVYESVNIIPQNKTNVIPLGFHERSQNVPPQNSTRVLQGLICRKQLSLVTEQSLVTKEMTTF